MRWAKKLILELKLKQIVVLSIILSFILYGNTLGHNYALDDAIVITNNEFTQQGLKGIPDILSYDSFTGFFGKEKKLVDGGRYRPLSLITFAIEYQIFGDAPWIGHFINILIYAFISILIYQWMVLLLGIKMGAEAAHLVALLVSALFLLHPIHTEVVANIKGRDELLSLLFSLLAFISALKYGTTKKLYRLFLSGVYLFLGVMSKENAIAFIVIIPLALWFFTGIDRKKRIYSAVSLFIGALGFFVIRYQVLHGFHQNVAGELMNNPFVKASNPEKYATILYTWLIYAKLLIFPHPLTFDYYPKHIPLVGFSNPWVILSCVLVLALVYGAFVGLKRKTVIGFAIIAFVATFSMVSNLLFTVGTFMNERFVFMPSLFWIVALSYYAMHLLKKKNKGLTLIVLLLGVYVVSFFPAKTIARNKAWENDLTLFTTDVKVSKNSAKSTCSAGGKLWELGKTLSDEKEKNKLFIQAESHLRKSIEIHPDYVDAWLLLGNVIFDARKDIEQSVLCFIEVIKRQPGNVNAWQNVDIVLQQSTDRDLQLKYYGTLYANDKNRYLINYRLGVLYGRYFSNLQKGIEYLGQAHKLNPKKVDALKDLGTAYGIIGRERDAYEICKKALELEKGDAQIYINMGIAASKLGYADEAKKLFEQAEKLK